MLSIDWYNNDLFGHLNLTYVNFKRRPIMIQRFTQHRTHALSLINYQSSCNLSLILRNVLNFWTWTFLENSGMSQHFWYLICRFLGITYWQFSWYHHVAKVKAKTMVPLPARLAHGYPQGWFYKISHFTNIFCWCFCFRALLRSYSISISN